MPIPIALVPVAAALIPKIDNLVKKIFGKKFDENWWKQYWGQVTVAYKQATGQEITQDLKWDQSHFEFCLHTCRKGNARKFELERLAAYVGQFAQPELPLSSEIEVPKPDDSLAGVQTLTGSTGTPSKDSSLLLIAAAAAIIMMK